MTNREWLNSLSDEDFVTWLTKDEDLVPSKDGDRFIGVQPSPRFRTLKSEWTSLAAGLTNWLREERK